MDYEPSESRKIEHSSEKYEIGMAMLSQLLSELHFQQTSELAVARQNLLRALTEPGSDAKRKEEVLDEYVKTGEAMIDTAVGPLGPENIERRAQMHIALTIHEACIFCEAGLIVQCAEKLEIAYEYARNKGFTVLCAGIDDVLDQLAD